MDEGGRMPSSRVELRDHIWHEDNDTLQFWGVRFGVTFR